VSDRHANFIVNRGQAKAGDVLALIRHIGRQVERQFGVTLELEVRIIGRAGGRAGRAGRRRTADAAA
jgi:UDP-N-acetylmuramate dehydrogenase